MKKFFALTCIALLTFALTGCTAGNKDINSANDDGVVSDQSSSYVSSHESNIVSDTVSMIESKTDEIVSAVR